MSKDTNSSMSDFLKRTTNYFSAVAKRIGKFVSDPTGRKQEIENLKLRIDVEVTSNEELQNQLASTQHQLEKARSYSDELAMELMIQELAANTDELTGAHNRKSLNYFLENVGKEVADKGYTGKGCVVAIDLDRFKQVNDTFGHHAGDEVLKAVVQRLQSLNLVSAESKLYRIGGDEFVLVVLDKRHDHDRRAQTRDEIDLSEVPKRGADRRKIPFEIYVHDAIRDAITQAASKTVSVKLQNGKEVEVDFGISEGIGHFDSIDKESMLEALREADSEAYVRKSGLDDFLAAYEQMSVETKEFVDNVLGLRFDENARGGYVIDREIGFSALAQMEEFQSFISGLSERSMRWIFPELHNLRAQSTSEFGR